MPQPEEPASGQGSVFQVMKRDIDDAMRVGILEPMPSDAGRVKQVWHSLKEVSKFYFRGVRQIWYNRVEVVALEKRVREGGSALTREETRFIRQYKQDAVKLIPFALTLLILEELIPLMVLYVPWMLPSTCILPSQGERMRLKAADKQRLYHARLRPDFEAIRARAAPATQIPVAALDTSGARALCGLLGLPEFGPALLRRRRLARHLGALAQDDALLRREGWGRQLVGAKLGDALHARGIPTRGLTAEEQELRLRYWLLESDKAPSVTAVEPDAVAKRVFLASTLAALRYTIALDAETKYPVLVPLDG